MRLYFVVSFYSIAVLKISQNLVISEQNNKLLFIASKIYAAIFCRIILFEDRCFEDFAILSILNSIFSKVPGSRGGTY